VTAEENNIDENSKSNVSASESTQLESFSEKTVLIPQSSTLEHTPVTTENNAASRSDTQDSELSTVASSVTEASTEITNAVSPAHEPIITLSAVEETVQAPAATTPSEAAPTSQATAPISAPADTPVQNTEEGSVGIIKRASNDPRHAPKPIVMSNIITETLASPSTRALDTTQPAEIQHNPRPLSRPSNDPRRAKRAATEEAEPKQSEQ
jgi:ribonuclease E